MRAKETRSGSATALLLTAIGTFSPLAGFAAQKLHNCYKLGRRLRFSFRLRVSPYRQPFLLRNGQTSRHCPSAATLRGCRVLPAFSLPSPTACSSAEKRKILREHAPDRVPMRKAAALLIPLKSQWGSQPGCHEETKTDVDFEPGLVARNPRPVSNH